MIETLVVYDNPCFAKCIHWVLLNVFRVKPLNENDENKKNGKTAQNSGRSKRIFRDFTNSSNSFIPMGCSGSTSLQGQQQLSCKGY
jgi:hypothetical protein